MDLTDLTDQLVGLSNPRNGMDSYITDNLLLFSVEELKQAIAELEKLTAIASGEKYGARFLVPKEKRRKKHPTLALALLSSQRGRVTIGFSDGKHFYKIENGKLVKTP